MTTTNPTSGLPAPSSSWWRRRRLVLLALLALAACLAALAINDHIRQTRLEPQHAAETMIRAYTNEISHDLRHAAFTNPPDAVTRQKNPDAWPTTITRPEATTPLTHAIHTYNTLHPHHTTSLRQINDHYGKNWKNNTLHPHHNPHDNAPAFIAWCQQNAHLTYKHDTTDPDGTHHHKGDTYKGEDTPSNFDYYSNPDSLRNRDLTPAPSGRPR